MIINGDSLEVLKTLEADSVDAICTDPPYGYSFMGKDWDKAVPSVEIWQECLRVLKPGGWCMVMSAPRSDVQNAMISRLMEAGFRLDFTPIYWTYASGFPKAGNVGKLVDKRQRGEGVVQRIDALLTKGMTLKEIGEKCGIPSLESSYRDWTTGGHKPEERSWTRIREGLQLTEDEVAELDLIVTRTRTDYIGGGSSLTFREGEKRAYEVKYTEAKSDAAKALDGSYTGFQPKPAVEVVIVAMKPLSEKTYVDQALKNGKGITWLDNCRVPTGDLTGRVSKGGNANKSNSMNELGEVTYVANEQGRFPANLLVQDDVLNGHSKYFDLDAWADTLPFLAVPKASKSEKNKGLELFEDKNAMRVNAPRENEEPKHSTLTKNVHPTVKPLKLMSYLITLSTRPGDTVLDPFVGSGTTVVAAKQLNRRGIGIEREQEYAEIALARYKHAESTLEQVSLQ